jgi:hypothetical protein
MVLSSDMTMRPVNSVRSSWIGVPPPARPTALAVGSLVLVCVTLLAFGWSVSPFRIQPLVALVLACVTLACGAREWLASAPETPRRTVAAFAVALSAVTLVAAALATAVFLPCGGRCF